MKECIELYSKLIIATITFVGPFIIAFLSVFTAGVSRRKALAQQTEEEINKQAKQELQTHPEGIKETIHKTSEMYKTNEKKTKAELAKLNPITQFWKIYGTLANCIDFSSMLF